MLKQQPFFLQSGVIFVSMLLHLQLHTTMAERRTDEVVDALMSNINEREEDAAFTVSGSMKKRNGSDRNKMGDDYLETDMTTALDLAIQVKDHYKAIIDQRADAADIIKRGEADILVLQEKIDSVDARLNKSMIDKQRCSKRIRKANKELTSIQVQYEELISKANGAIFCLKGDCTKVDTKGVTETTKVLESNIPHKEVQLKTVQVIDFDAQLQPTIHYLQVDDGEKTNTTEVDGREGTNTTKESITTSTFWRQTATTSNV